MALPALLNGADCGPVNPLQALSKQFERDRGVQQDHFGPARAGPSREVFRTQSAPAPGLDQDATRFFSGQSSSGVAFVPQYAPNAFDLSTLQGSLPQQQQQQQPRQPPSSSAWAGDFLSNQSLQSINHKSHLEANKNSFNDSDISHVNVQNNSHLPSINPSYIPVGMFRPSMQHMPMFQEPHHPNFDHHLQHTDSIPAATNIQMHFPPEEVAIQHQQRPSDPVDADELARTAGRLIETVKDETNPKFQKSAFLGLMRQLRDKEMVIEGSDMIKAPTAALAGPNEQTGERRSSAPMPTAQTRMNMSFVPSQSDPIALEQRELRQELHELASQNTEALPERSRGSAVRKSVHFDRPEALQWGIDSDERADQLTSNRSEDSDAAFWRQENAEYREYWRERHDARDENQYAATPEWDKLQEDWDRFEATATGVRPVSTYHFQPNNPYLLGESSTRNHAIHTQSMDSNESILEKEAAVQKDPRNAAAWFELGVKQQENEREPMAIQALQRAVELAPSYLAAWLALAISHTNENDRDNAYDAIEHWVRHNNRYDGAQLIEQMERNGGRTAGERHNEMVQCLIGLARTMPEGEVDADVQTALGVLLNTGEEYEKAQDCFRTALAVRPDDWLLYNRVGATLANSGRAADALWYYYRALHLNPSYIRARFNLGISCINMKRYQEAAEHILDALALQEKDAFEGSDTRGITPSALWDCLRTTCVHLQRLDLTGLCDAHELEGFRKAFMGV